VGDDPKGGEEEEESDGTARLKILKYWIDIRTSSLNCIASLVWVAY